MELRLVDHLSPEYQQTVELRREVLRIPLGLDFTEAELLAECSDLHLAAFEGGELIGCLVLTPLSDGELKMRQVCVSPDLQKGGIGSQMVLASEEIGRERGFVRMVLNARDAVVPFYERLGYTVEGEPFEEVTIPHRRMAKKL